MNGVGTGSFNAYFLPFRWDKYGKAGSLAQAVRSIQKHDEWHLKKRK